MPFLDHSNPVPNGEPWVFQVTYFSSWLFEWFHHWPTSPIQAHIWLLGLPTWHPNRPQIGQSLGAAWSARATCGLGKSRGQAWWHCFNHVCSTCCSINMAGCRDFAWNQDWESICNQIRKTWCDGMTKQPRKGEGTVYIAGPLEGPNMIERYRQGFLFPPL